MKKAKHDSKNNQIIKFYILNANKLNLHCNGLKYSHVCFTWCAYACSVPSVFLQFRLKCFIQMFLCFPSFCLSISFCTEWNSSYDFRQQAKRFVHTFAITITVPHSMAAIVWFVQICSPCFSIKIRNQTGKTNAALAYRLKCAHNDRNDENKQKICCRTIVALK